MEEQMTSNSDTTFLEGATSAAAIREHMERILASDGFRATDVQKLFLRFVVETVLAGRSHEIKGYTIATQVFGRGEEFNQATDPIVSIHANKLRRALEHYYLTEGSADSLRIEIPKGSYVPSFIEHTNECLSSQPSEVEPAIIRFDGSWPIIEIRPFRNLSQDSDLDYIAIGLGNDLGLELNRFKDVRVLIQGLDGCGRGAQDSGARFAIEGSIRRDTAKIKMAVQLHDLSTGIQIWADSHSFEWKNDHVITFQEEVARIIAGKICAESGVISNALLPESKKIHPADLKTYEAILRYYAFGAQFSPESFFKALEALKLATSKEPENGVVWSMLARLYATNYGLELFEADTPLTDAAVFAERGVMFDPDSQRCSGILSYVLLIKNDLSQGLAEARRAASLDPNSLIMMADLGHLLCLLGDWERGSTLIRLAIEKNPYYNCIAHHALCLDWLRRKDYLKAYAETLRFRVPLLFWDPLLKAATLGLLGKIEEGRKAGADLLKLKPNFSSRGLTLIQYHIKFDEIVEMLIDGLGKVGIDIS